MTSATGDDGLAAALIQVADHTERIVTLDSRECAHHQQVTARLQDLTAEITTTMARTDALSATVSHHSAIVNALDGLDTQVAELTRQLADQAAASPGGKGARYRPVPSPRWWKLRGTDRDTAVGRLQAWVERIYRPGYGKIAAALPHAGSSTRSACTPSTGSANCGRPSTWPHNATPGS